MSQHSESHEKSIAIPCVIFRFHSDWLVFYKADMIKYFSILGITWFQNQMESAEQKYHFIQSFVEGHISKCRANEPWEFRGPIVMLYKTSSRIRRKRVDIVFDEAREKEKNRREKRDLVASKKIMLPESVNAGVYCNWTCSVPQSL